MSERQEWKDQIKAKAKIVMRVTNTEEGKALIDLLEATFQSGTILGSDPQQTAYNAGQFELVAYLKQLRDFGDIDG